MSPLRPHANFKYKLFFSIFVLVSSSMPLVVDHVIGVVVVGNCDQPIITCTSLSKSTITTPNASIGGCS